MIAVSDKRRVVEAILKDDPVHEAMLEALRPSWAVALNSVRPTAAPGFVSQELFQHLTMRLAERMERFGYRQQVVKNQVRLVNDRQYDSQVILMHTRGSKMAGLDAFKIPEKGQVSVELIESVSSLQLPLPGLEVFSKPVLHYLISDVEVKAGLRMLTAWLVFPVGMDKSRSILLARECHRLYEGPLGTDLAEIEELPQSVPVEPELTERDLE